MSTPITADTAPASAPRRIWWLLGGLAALTLPGIVARLSGVHLAPVAQVIVAGTALIAAAFLLAWAAEAAQTVMAGGFAIALLALITVLPEYAVDVVFAWNAAHSPAEAHYAVANMTGANRLLIGVGWSGIVLLAAALAWRKGGRHPERTAVGLPAHSVVEVVVLLLATAYALILPWRGSITLVDTLVLFALFGGYLWFLARSGQPESAEDLVGPARHLAQLPHLRWWLAGIFMLAALAILAVAEPFADGLVEMGQHLHVDNFILVQIVAPLASEAPEFVVVALFVVAGRGSMALQALVSSKVNQWTLLIGSIPLVYSIAAGGPHAFALDPRQTEEILLTAAQGVLAVILVLDRRLGIWESMLLLVLYCGQFFFNEPAARSIFAWGYLALSALVLICVPAARRGLVRAPRRLLQQVQFAATTHKG